jgi:ssDNA-binding Zn-finger/Zn-ribbon topoisomerase 1
MTQTQTQTQQTQMTVVTEENETFQNYNIKAEDFFKSPEEIKAKRMLEDDEEESMMIEEKTVLAETNFMICDKCNESPVRIKQSNEGYLFATCTGFPRCKNAMHTMPRCVRNLQILEDDECEKCRSTQNRSVLKFKITFFGGNQIRAMKEICQQRQNTFCLN